MGHLDAEFGVLKAMVDQNCGVVENFLEDVKIRVETAMTDYKNEMHEEFQLTEKVNEAMKAEILAQFENSAGEIEEKDKENISAMFSSQAVLNGGLWQGLLSTQEKTVLEIMKKHAVNEKIELKNEIQQEVWKNCKVEVQKQLESQKKWLETTVEIKLGGMTKFKEIEEKIEKYQGKMMESQEKVVGTQAYLTQKVAALGTGMNFLHVIVQNVDDGGS